MIELLIEGENEWTAEKSEAARESLKELYEKQGLNYGPSPVSASKRATIESVFDPISFSRWVSLFNRMEKNDAVKRAIGSTPSIAMVCTQLGCFDTLLAITETAFEDIDEDYASVLTAHLFEKMDFHIREHQNEGVIDYLPRVLDLAKRLVLTYSGRIVSSLNNRFLFPSSIVLSAYVNSNRLDELDEVLQLTEKLIQEDFTSTLSFFNSSDKFLEKEIPFAKVLELIPDLYHISGYWHYSKIKEVLVSDISKCTKLEILTVSPNAAVRRKQNR